MKDDDITVGIYRDQMSMGTTFSATVDHKNLMDAYGRELIQRVLDKVSDHIAAEFVEKYGVEIAARLSPDAVANLSVAAAGAKINETLNKKMPDKILEVERRSVETVVVQRGLLGGLKRLR